MSRKSITLALAAAVSVGAFALSAPTASAFHPSGPGASMHAVGNPGMHVYSKPMVTGIKIKPPMVTGIVINKPPKITGIIIKPPHWRPYWHWNYGWWRPRIWTAPVIAAGGVATYAATTPSTNRCTCLTKDYTPQGAVVFKDVCTNEMAMNPPVNASPAAEMAPQMPQQPTQQGYLQSQAQPQVQ